VIVGGQCSGEVHVSNLQLNQNGLYEMGMEIKKNELYTPYSMRGQGFRGYLSHQVTQEK